MTELSVLDLSIKTFNAMNRLGLKSVEDVVSELKTIHASNAYRRDVEDGLCRYFGGGRFELGKWYDGDECGDGELLTYDDLTEMAGLSCGRAVTAISACLCWAPEGLRTSPA